MSRELASNAIDVGEFPFELTPEELGSACRRAYMRLVVGAHVGWGKPELARWLTGPYRRLTVREDATSDVVEIAPPSLAIANDTVSEDRLMILLDAMRTDVIGVLRELMTPEGLGAFTKLALDTELVVRTADASVLPRARPRMTLVDRVLSLIAVDAITRPEDFEHSLFICDRCHQPVFDVAARPLGICRVHASGVERHDLE
jgi:hypothetical protein